MPPSAHQWVKTMASPAGEKSGLLRRSNRLLLPSWPVGGELVSRVLPLPSARITQMSPRQPAALPESQPSKVIIEPSGDQFGYDATMPQGVSCSRPPLPSARTLKTACTQPFGWPACRPCSRERQLLKRVNATHAPSGDHAGSLSKSDPAGTDVS